MEKAYDRVNKKKLFEEMRSYGVHDNLAGLIERIHDGSMVIFKLENMATGGRICLLGDVNRFKCFNTTHNPLDQVCEPLHYHIEGGRGGVWCLYYIHNS